MLARIVDPTAGQVILEGGFAQDYKLAALRRAVRYVPQQPVLFSGSIRQNLSYAASDATESEISRAVKAAQFLPMLDRLPCGLDTILRGDAVGLSGGERQRSAIARALLRHSAILILDKATSALDLPAEEAVFRSIASLRRDMALVVISHRLTVVGRPYHC